MRTHWVWTYTLRAKVDWLCLLTHQQRELQNMVRKLCLVEALRKYPQLVFQGSDDQEFVRTYGVDSDVLVALFKHFHPAADIFASIHCRLDRKGERQAAVKLPSLASLHPSKNVYIYIMCVCVCVCVYKKKKKTRKQDTIGRNTLAVPLG